MFINLYLIHVRSRHIFTKQKGETCISPKRQTGLDPVTFIPDNHGNLLEGFPVDG